MNVSIENSFSQFVSIQSRYSMLTRYMEEDLLPVCEENNVSILPTFP